MIIPNLHLLTIINYAILYSATPLDKEQPCRRIRQPHAVTHQRTVRTIYPNTGFCQPVFSYPAVFGGMGREPKKTPPLCLPLVWHCLAATRSALHKHQCKALIMLYTFIIAYPCAKKAQLHQLRRVRTISAIANTEQEARAQLSGLPLVFVRQTTTPTKTRLLTPLWGNPVPGSGHPMLQGGAA